MFRPSVTPFARVATIAVAALALVLAPAAAHAHSTVEDTVPRTGAVLTELPERFTVTVDEELLDLGGEGAGFVMVTRDAEGLYYGESCALVEGDTMSVPAALGEPGDYAITWQLISADGHPLAGSIEFEWAPEGDFTATDGSVEPDACASGGSTSDDTADAAADERGFSMVPVWIVIGVAGIAVAGALIFLAVNRARRNQS